MTTTIPPVSPEAENPIERELSRAMQELLLRSYRAGLSPQECVPVATRARSTFSLWLPGVITSILQGITLIGLLGFAFWFGGVSKTVDNTADQVKTLRDAVSGDRQVSLSNRMSVVETKLDGIEKKLDQLAPLPKGR